jgi:phospholipid transport system substrate-binding protein
MMKNYQRIFQYLFASLFLISGVIFAQTPDQSTPPDALIKMVVTEVMATVKSDPDIQKGSIPKIVELVEKKIVPYTLSLIHI